MIIAVDPGVKYLAWAAGKDRLLVSCGMYTGHFFNWYASAEVPGFPELLLVECPDRVFRGDPRDVFATARAAGEIGIQCTNTRYVTPSQWKGSMPKAAHHKNRVLPALLPEELALLPALKKDRVHVLDAVGILMWHFGRMT